MLHTYLGSGTFDLSDAIPLDRFLDSQLVEIDHGKEGKSYKLDELLDNNNGSVILAIRRPG